MYRRALAIYQRVHGTDSLYGALTLHAIASILFVKGQFEEALEELNVAHAVFELLTKGQHAKVIDVVELQEKCHRAIAARDAMQASSSK